MFLNIVPSLEMDLPSLEIVSISRDEFVISRDEVPFLEIDSISRDGCPISRIQFRHGFMRRGARRHGVCSDRMRHLGFPSARLILKFRNSNLGHLDSPP